MCDSSSVAWPSTIRGSPQTERTYDLKSAYKQFGVDTWHSRFLKIAVKNPEGGFGLFDVYALPFGATGSVTCFFACVKCHSTYRITLLGPNLVRFFQPALWYSGIADGLRAWRWQLAAVRLPPGPGRESDVVHRLRLKCSDQGACPKWRSQKNNLVRFFRWL